MDERQLIKYKKMLLDLRKQILQAMQKNDKKESYSELSGEHPLSFHLADQGADYSEYEKSFLLASIEGNVLQRIDDALARIDEGSYGKCVICGADIHLKRLEAVPYAGLCIDCKEKEEKGLL